MLKRFGGSLLGHSAIVADQGDIGMTRRDWTIFVGIIAVAVVAYLAVSYL